MDAKSSCCYLRDDAISWLPDEVLARILSLLPTKQAVSTSLLSKKWRHVFRLVDYHDFDDSLQDEQARNVFPESFENFVDRTLASQGDSPIRKFSLKCHVGKDDGYKRQKACVGRWISNIARRRVSEAELRLKCRGVDYLPPPLLSCKTLVKLTLGTHLCLDNLPSYVSLPSLKFLFIDTVFFPFKYLSGVLLAGCPVLEELTVHHKQYIAPPHTISSPTIKRLSVYYNSPQAVWENSFMLFDLPKLVYLNYADFALPTYEQVNFDSLVEAELNIHPLKPNSLWTPDVTNLIVGIRNVEILHLFRLSADAIWSYCRDGRLPSFDNLVKLSFEGFNEQGWKLLTCLLKQSPKLETLIIQGLDGYTDDVTIRPFKVKVLHVRGYGGTTKELEQLRSFLGGTECIEKVRLDFRRGVVVDEDKIMQTYRDLATLPGVAAAEREIAYFI